MKAFPHSLQAKGFSPAWILWCLRRLELVPNVFPHSLHSKGFSPLCTLTCWMRCEFWLKAFPHSLHVWGLSPPGGPRALVSSPPAAGFSADAAPGHITTLGSGPEPLARSLCFWPLSPEDGSLGIIKPDPSSFSWGHICSVIPPEDPLKRPSDTSPSAVPRSWPLYSACASFPVSPCGTDSSQASSLGSSSVSSDPISLPEEAEHSWLSC